MQEENKNGAAVNQNEKKLKIGLFIDTFFPMVDGVINVQKARRNRFYRKTAPKRI